MSRAWISLRHWRPGVRIENRHQFRQFSVDHKISGEAWRCTFFSLKTIYGLAIDLNDLFTLERLTSSCNHVCYSLLPHHFNNQFNRAPAIQIGQNLGLGGNMPFLSASLTITLAILDSFFSCSFYGSSSKAVCF